MYAKCIRTNVLKSQVKRLSSLCHFRQIRAQKRAKFSRIFSPHNLNTNAHSVTFQNFCNTFTNQTYYFPSRIFTQTHNRQFAQLSSTMNYSNLRIFTQKYNATSALHNHTYVRACARAYIDEIFSRPYTRACILSGENHTHPKFWARYFPLPSPPHVSFL